MFCARLFICALWSPAGKGLTSWLSFVVSSVSLSLSHWYPGSGVVLDCIDSWSLHHYLLSGYASKLPLFKQLTVRISNLLIILLYDHFNTLINIIVSTFLSLTEVDAWASSIYFHKDNTCKVIYPTEGLQLYSLRSSFPSPAIFTEGNRCLIRNVDDAELMLEHILKTFLIFCDPVFDYQ